MLLIDYNSPGDIMKNLVLEKENQKIYLEDVNENVERIKDYLKKSLKDFSFIHGFSISLLLNNYQEGNFFSLDSFQGLVLEQDEIKARKILLDLLKLSKNMFKDLFFIECIEAKKEKELEEYSLILLDDDQRSYEVLTLDLIKEDRIYVSFKYNELYEVIYHLISSYKGNDLPFDASFTKIAFSLIQRTKNGVMKTCKELQEELVSYRSTILSEENYLEAREEISQEGIPVIIEIGPSNVRKEELTLITKLGRIQIQRSEVKEEIEKVRKLLNEEYYKKSFKSTLKYQAKCLDFDKLNSGNRFCLCEDPNCLNKVLEKTDSKNLYHTFSNVRFSKKCIVCSKEAKISFSPSNVA